jgi:hypothetical protein
MFHICVEESGGQVVIRVESWKWPIWGGLCSAVLVNAASLGPNDEARVLRNS